MSNKVDRLFKEKLEGDSMQPSAQAWEKVEAHLGKKNKMVFWTRVAAAVTLLGLLTFAGVNWNGGDKKEIVKQESGGRSRESGGRSQAEGVKEQHQVDGKKEEHKQITKQEQQRKVVTPVIEQPREQEQQLAIVPEAEVIKEPQVETQPDAAIHNSQSTTEKGITLTYSLPAVKKQDAPAEPQVAEQKKSGFERVIEIAKEVKNGDALGELRQAKDDIFALDFRKDKNRKQ
jgi:hypothetical protein